MAYTRPIASNIPFKFTTKGYTTPDSQKVRFRFGTAEFSSLKAAIAVFGQDYIKECPTIVVGYSSGAPQILQLPCVYTGFRHLSAYLQVLPPNVTLTAYIYAVSNYLDISAFLRTTIQTYLNLSATVYSIPSIHLSAFVHGFDVVNLYAELQGFELTDLDAVISGHLPANLFACLNIIEIQDLPGYIKGEWLHGIFNLQANIYKIYQRGRLNLRGILHGYDVTDLVGLITIVYKYDLAAFIRSSTIFDLNAFIYNIIPYNLSAQLHGFDAKLLFGSITGGYSPGHLRAYLYVVPPSNLKAVIHGYKGIKVSSNLRANVSSFYMAALTGSIVGIGSIDLAASVVIKGYSNTLQAKIRPKVVHLKKVVLVSLLEHIDLNAVINYSCFASSFSDLNGYLYPIYKNDLRAYIFSWKSDDGYLDLAASINTALYNVEDKFDVKYVPSQPKYTSNNIVIRPRRAYYSYDTIDVLFGAYYFKNLMASVVGTLRFSNLSAYVKPHIPRNYSELPEYVKPKSHEVVIKFDTKGREKWRRFVELMFKKDGDEPYHYFYVSGENKVYKVDKTRHWTIWAYSYVSDKTDMIERNAVRTKFIFDISKYNSIDEAVRDLIDRVAVYREFDLSARINAYLDKISYLKAKIMPQGNARYRWSTYLRASIICN